MKVLPAALVATILRPEDAVQDAPVLPDGYMTVGQWWAEYEPASLAEMPDPIETISRDATSLVMLCEQRGIHYEIVPLSPMARKLGMTPTRAFPLWLLMEFYPVNP